MSVLRLVPTAFVCAAIATPVSADVTLHLKGNGRVFGGDTPDSTEYRKGLTLRTDSIASGGTVSTIHDLAAGRVIVLWHFSKTAEVIERQTIAQALARAGLSETPPSITPTAESRQIAGWTCIVHNVKSSSGPMAVEMTPALPVVVEGTVCLVKNGPGQAEFAAFYRAIAESVFLLDPQRAKEQPAAARATADYYRRMAELGVPFATEMTISFGPDGPPPDVMKEAGNTYRTEVTSVSTAPIPDSMFEIPADYTVVKR